MDEDDKLKRKIINYETLTFRLKSRSPTISFASIVNSPSAVIEMEAYATTRATVDGRASSTITLSVKKFSRVFWHRLRS